MTAQWRKLAMDLKAVAEKAVPAPWRHHDSTKEWDKGAFFISGSDKNGTHVLPMLAHVFNFPGRTEHNAAFIAASRTGIPALADALIQACDELEEARKTQRTPGMYEVCPHVFDSDCANGEPLCGRTQCPIRAIAKGE